MKIIKLIDDHFEEFFLILFLLIITFDTGLQCVMRYIFNDSLSWTDELSKYSFIYSGFFSIGYCMKKGSNLRVDILLQYLPRKIGKVLELGTIVLSLAFFAYMFFPSLSVIQYFLKTKTLSPALQLPMVLIYGVPFIGFTVGILRCVQFLLKSIKTNFMDDAAKLSENEV